MPARQNIRVIASKEVQGDDSWVKTKALTVGQANLLAKLVRESQTVTDEARAKEIEREMFGIFADAVIEWNWVDDEGKPLPKPVDVSSFDVLTMPELMWLAQCLREGEKKTG